MKSKYIDLLYASVCAIIVSFLMLNFNPIGERFPHQDLMWNDLVLLNKLTFLKEALSTGLGSTIDFTQGFGVDITSDIKSQSSLFDVANPFLLFLGPVAAANIRFFFLVLYGFLGVYLYTRSVVKPFPKEISIFLAVLYVSSPQFLGEVSHLTGVVFLTLPSLILALNNWFKKFDRRSFLLLIISLVITGGVSDLNIFIFIPYLFLWHAATEVRLFLDNPKRFVSGYLICTVFLVATFSNILACKFLYNTATVTNSLVHSSIRDYTSVVLLPTLKSFLKPFMPGPVTLFLYPALFIFIFVFKKVRLELKETIAFSCFLLFGILIGYLPYLSDTLKASVPIGIRYHLGALPFLLPLFIFIFVFKKVRLELKTIAFLCFLLFGILIGYLPYLSDTLKASVPSYIRYHLGALPFLLLLSVVSYLGIGTRTQLLNKTAALEDKDYLRMFAIVSIILLLNVIFGDIRTFLGMVLFTFWLFVPFLIFTLNYKSKLKRRILCFVFSIIVPFMSYCLFSEVFPIGNLRIIDKEYSKYYLDTLPKFIKRYTGGGSFVPIAKSPFGPESGRNDGLLSLLELPDRYDGRTFLQWRHSYPKPTSDVYSKYGATGHGTVNFFPFGQGQLSKLVEFAELTGSDYIISLGIELPSSKFDFVASSWYERQSAIRSLEQESFYRLQFFNKINLYKIIHRDKPERPYRLKYSRTYIEIELEQPVDEIEIPVVFFNTFRAKSQFGDRVALYRSENGFTKINTSGREKQTITVYSFDPLRFLPVLGLLIFLGLTFTLKIRT